MQARILALATAVPPFALRQAEVRARAGALFGDDRGALDHLLPVFDNAAIDTRYSCLPVERYHAPLGWAERNRLYLDNATALLAEVTHRCLASAGLEAGAIDAIVVVSTTGIATPSLDARLLNRLAFRADVQRLPIFGLGCAGGVIGLARAARLAEAMPGSRVLFLVVELCALCFRRNDLSKSNIVATALFGDGAAGAILSTAGEGARVGAGGEHTWPGSLDIMGWDVVEDGLKALFSRDIPSLVRNRLRPALDEFLARHGIEFAALGGFVCHPGGAKVLTALEAAFAIAPGGLVEARRVLRDFGNMSAATVLFVLERVLRKGIDRLLLMSALGPGFTAGFLLLDNR
jgi:alkylresorcinol/alkylpyrone synthase